MNDNFETYYTKKGDSIFVRSNEIPKIKKAEIEDVAIGIVSKIIKQEWRVRSSIFHFKFDFKGKAINFAIKYNIPLENEYYFSIVEMLCI